jgi:hypothetical protein
MFNRKKPSEGPPSALLERAKAIGAKSAPEAYNDVGGRGKRAMRSKVFRQGVATLSGGERLEVAIKNLSPNGCRIEFFRQTTLTPTLILEEPSIPLHFEAEVIWQGDGAAGLRILGATAEE